MTPRTRDTLLWLAGLGGALVLLRQLLDLAFGLRSFLPPLLVGILLALAAAGVAALLALRSRLGSREADEPLSFLEHRP